MILMKQFVQMVLFAKSRVHFQFSNIVSSKSFTIICFKEPNFLYSIGKETYDNFRRNLTNYKLIQGNNIANFWWKVDFKPSKFHFILLKPPFDQQTIDQYFLVCTIFWIYSQAIHPYCTFRCILTIFAQNAQTCLRTYRIFNEVYLQ